MTGEQGLVLPHRLTYILLDQHHMQQMKPYVKAATGERSVYSSPESQDSPSSLVRGFPKHFDSGASLLPCGDSGLSHTSSPKPLWCHQRRASQSLLPEGKQGLPSSPIASLPVRSRDKHHSLSAFRCRWHLGGTVSSDCRD